MSPETVAKPRTCEKRRYANERDAREFMKTARAMYPHKTHRAYPCKRCGGWHITTHGHRWKR